MLEIDECGELDTFIDETLDQYHPCGAEKDCEATCADQFNLFGSPILEKILTGDNNEDILSSGSD